MLVQSYDSGRLGVHHFDLYRLAGASDMRELGLEAALGDGVALIEWPERLGGHVPADRFVIRLEPGSSPDHRTVTLLGHGSAAPRLDRLVEMRAFVAASGLAAAMPAFLQGDASRRAYARLHCPGQPTLVLMDSPKQPEGPPVRDGRSYSQIAHLAEEVRPFVAVGNALRRAGLSAPEVVAQDLDRGFLILEDLGDLTYGEALAQGRSQAELYRAATDVLIEMRRLPPGRDLPLPDGTVYTLPRFDRAALEIEIDLLLDWYWPEVKGSPVPGPVRAEFYQLWSPVLDRLLAEPPGWFLRDYHSPNLMWLPERPEGRRIGLIDYQDAVLGPPAYDVASLLQDARVDVDEALEIRLLGQYARLRREASPDFDMAVFARDYAVMGAQRATKILGIFARLNHRDGKPRYLAHLPRIERYLGRCLSHPALAELAAWYRLHVPGFGPEG
jgi:aminoglycoside/choline kinase family phosphotransferase